MDTKVQSAQAQRIRELNDQLRTTFFQRHGRVLITPGIDALPVEVKRRVVEKVKAFEDFESGNDLYRQHDFGSFEIDRQTIFWKIDLYEEPNVKDANGEPVVTRVLTIKLANEY